MYLIKNANPHSCGFYVNGEGGQRTRAVVPAKGEIEVDLSERQATKLKSWQGISMELIGGTEPSPEPAAAPVVTVDEAAAPVTEQVMITDVPPKAAKEPKTPKVPKKPKAAKEPK